MKTDREEVLAVKLETTHKSAKPPTNQPNYPQTIHKPATNQSQANQTTHKPPKLPKDHPNHPLTSHKLAKPPTKQP